MIVIQFPEPDFTIRQEGGQDLIFDKIRKKYIVLTPEEWVRQNFIHYLVAEKKYPATLFAVEKEIHLGSMRKRCDIIVYNRNSAPWMIVECKEMEVPVDEKTMEQILRYNMAVPVQYLVLTNGVHTYCVERMETEWKLLEELPAYGDSL